MNLVISWLGIGCFVFMVGAYSMPRWAYVILAALTFFGLIFAIPVAAALGIREWRGSSQLWMMPAIVALVWALSVWMLAPYIGRRLADWQFQRYLGEYTAIEEGVRLRTIPCPAGCNTRLVTINVKRPPSGVILVQAALCGDGSVVVAFVVATTVPLLRGLCNQEIRGWEYVRYKGHDTRRNVAICSSCVGRLVPLFRSAGLVKTATTITARPFSSAENAGPDRSRSSRRVYEQPIEVRY